MLTPTLIMGGVAGALVLAGYYQGNNLHITGLQISAKMIVQMMPLLLSVSYTHLTLPTKA